VRLNLLPSCPIPLLPYAFGNPVRSRIFIGHLPGGRTFHARTLHQSERSKLMTDDAYTERGRIPAATNSAAARLALKRATLAIGCGVIGAYGLGAVLTYSPEDPSLNTAAEGVPHNLFGAPGAMLADLAVQSLGAARAFDDGCDACGWRHSRDAPPTRHAHRQASHWRRGRRHRAARRCCNHDPNARGLAARDRFRRHAGRRDRQRHHWPCFDAWFAIPASADRHRLRLRRHSRCRLVIPSAPRRCAQRRPSHAPHRARRRASDTTRHRLRLGEDASRARTRGNVILSPRRQRRCRARGRRRAASAHAAPGGATAPARS
jgi:hypothetical protein